MTIRRFNIWVILFLLSFNKGISQLVDIIGLEDGLSSGFVHDIMQSSDGFMYFGLKTGLNRYDGYETKHYKHNPFDPYSISSTTVNKICEDQHGYLWIATKKGNLDIFNPKTERFHRVADFTKLRYNKNYAIRLLFVDPSGAIWIGLINGKVFKLKTPTNFKLDSDTDAISFQNMLEYEFQIGNNPNFNYDDSPRIAHLYNHHFDHQNRLWLTTNDGQLIKVDWQNNQYQMLFQSKNAGLYFPQVFDTPDGKVWYKNTHEFCKIENDQIIPIPIAPWFKEAYFHGMDEDQNLIYDKGRPGFKYSFEYYKSPATELLVMDPKSELLFAHKSTSARESIFDHTGIFWTKSRVGITKFNPNKKFFEHYFKGLSIYDIYHDGKASLLFRTSNYDNYHFHIPTKTISPFPEIYPKKTDILMNPIVMDQNNFLILYNHNIDTPNNRFQLIEIINETWPLHKKDHPSANVNKPSYTTDKTGRSWTISSEGMILLDFQNERTKTFPFKFKKPLEEKILPVGSYVDHFNQMWIATLNGVIKTNSNELDQKPLMAEIFKNDSNNKNSLSNSAIKCIHDDPLEPEKYIWIGTDGGGLNRMDRKTKECIHFTTTNSNLPDDVVYQIQQDEKGRLWMSTNKGISSFDVKNRIFKNYTREDGLQDLEFNTNSSTKLPNGNLVFGGINGFNIFNPNTDNLVEKAIIPPVRITDLYINNKKVQTYPIIDSAAFQLKQAIEYTDKIELVHDQNSIRLQFAALDFTQKNKNQYRYRLTEDNSEKTAWAELGTENKVQFSKLLPGNYLFEVMGSNHNEVWNETPAQLRIIIHPPWWKSVWAYAAYALILLAGLFWINRFQVNRSKLKNQLAFEQKEAERLQELDKIKSNFFSNITHEFRTPLTLILEPIRQLLKEDSTGEVKQKLELAKNNSEKLLTLVNQLMDVSKLEASKMKLDLRKGNINDIIRKTFNSFLPLAQQKNIQLKLNLEEPIDPFYFDKDKFEKVLYNLVSNAIKFTQKGEVQIKIATSKREHLDSSPILNIQVSDTGIGIPSDQLSKVFERFYQVDGSHTRKGQGTGIGLALTKELVELMEGKINVESKLGVHTTFTVRLPMEQIESDQTTSMVLNNNPTPNIVLSNADQPSPSTSDQPLVIDNEKDLVLIIEDNDELRQFIKQSLSPSFQVAQAVDGKEGIKMAKELTPDLIVSDLMMPHKDGYEVVDDLKNDVKTSHIPIILLTAKTAIESKLKGLRRGADDYLTKPFNTEELMARMNNLIATRKKLQKRFAGSLIVDHKTETPPIETPPTETSVVENTSQESPTPAPLSKLDEDFLAQIKAYIEAHIDNPALSVTTLAKQVFMSRSQLFRKLKALTNQTPNIFIRNYRLDRAMELFKTKKGNTAYVAMQVGFEDPKYFSRRFKERFGISPKKLSS